MARKKQSASRPTDADPEWIIDEGSARVFSNLVGYNLRRAHAVQRQRFADAYKSDRIRPVQLSILGLILNNPGIRPSMLGRALEIKRANIVPLLDELEKRGLLERNQSPTDRRSRIISLTPKGQTLTKRLLERHDRLEEELAQQLGARNRRHLLKLLMEFRKIGTPEGLDD